MSNDNEERFVYRWLQEHELSPEAQRVLDLATELTMRTLPFRNEADPKLQATNWDAGYYQLKGLWKEHCPELWEEFRAAYKALGDKMRPKVYELGFLKEKPEFYPGYELKGNKVVRTKSDEKQE